MKKINLLLLFLIVAFGSTIAQNKTSSSTDKKSEKVLLKSAEPKVQTVEKKGNTVKAVKVQMLDVEKQKATTTPKQKAKSEDSDI
ncbi:MAG: hypothetical protein P8M12_06760 [Flavobacteriales bacterium]|jgi:hypothetical protein|nr:hypothetical protein [Flavobacteriales bacterium]